MILQTYKPIILILFLSLPGHASAAKWAITPQLNASTTYYDNITLSETDKNKELVTQIQPGMMVSATGKRLQLTSGYSFGYVDYYGSEFNDTHFNSANASLNLEAIRRHLFISSTASISQQVIDPSRPGASVDPNTVTNNRTETRSWSIIPTLRNRFGSFANSVLSDQYSIVDYSSNAINSSWTNTLNYTLSSGNWFNQLTWNGNASYQTSEQGNANSAQANARVNYAFTDHWSVFALGRVEKFNYALALTDSNRYFVNAEAGLVWTPSRKLQAEAGGGAVLDSSALSNKRIETEQYTWRAKILLRPTSRTEFEAGREQAAYGSREHLSFNHYSRKTRIGSTYAETLITPQQSRLSSGQSSGINLNPGNFGGAAALSRAITDDVILRKRLDVLASLSLRKLSLNANTFLENGDYQTRNDSDKRYGGSGGGQLNIGRRSNLSASASLQRYYFSEADQVDNIYQFNTSASRTLSKHMNVSLTYLWQKRNSNVQLANYSSNRISAQVNITF